MPGMRLLVTGSRDWTDENLVWKVLHRLEIDTLVVGDCPTGLDRMAREMAIELGWNVEVHYARWQEHGKAAGPIRNQEMVDSGAIWCYAFLKTGALNIGTRGCMAKAKKAGIGVTEFWE